MNTLKQPSFNPFFIVNTPTKRSPAIDECNSSEERRPARPYVVVSIVIVVLAAVLLLGGNIAIQRLRFQYESERRPIDDGEYLDKAYELDLQFVDYFNYVLRLPEHRHNEIERYLKFQAEFGGVDDDNHRLNLALDRYTKNSSERHRVFEAILSQRMLFIESLVVGLLDRPTNGLTKGVEVALAIFDKNLQKWAAADLDLNRTLAEFTPGLIPSCLMPFPTAKNLLELYENTYTEGDPSCLPELQKIHMIPSSHRVLVISFNVGVIAFFVFLLLCVCKQQVDVEDHDISAA
ncbi:hypothetical protein QR680_018643 [Steinernema hermaphroditum]|uniref:Uncharacterized protein n=1 Tax=Steinernema hermaphroditum TaxID=289476 RepID=A0AA39HKV6_9BILA|nr:hypothetical protein QR680_018643 [Steinernema hermaphroditum]